MQAMPQLQCSLQCCNVHEKAWRILFIASPVLDALVRLSTQGVGGWWWASS